MNAIITKTLDTLLSQTKKIPEFLLIISIFTFLFKKQAKEFYKFVSNLILQLSPDNLIQTIKKIDVSQKQILEFWSVLFALIFLIVVWNLFKHFILTPNSTNLELGGENLLFINSIIFPIVFIYNNLSDAPNQLIITFPKQDMSILYYACTFLGFFVFLIYYSFSYLAPLFGVFTTIAYANIKIGYKVILISIYMVILSKLATELLKYIFGL
jgi:hypothetical protein